MRRTKEQAEETKNQILLAAEELFLEKGYDNVSLEVIAAKAGLTRGAVHWHFKNKQGLLVAIRTRAQEPLFQLAEKTESQQDISLSDLEKQVSDYFTELERDPRWQGLIRVIMKADIAQKDQTGEEHIAFYTRLHGALYTIFKTVESNRGLPDHWTAESATAMFASTVTGLMLKWAMTGEKISLKTDGKAYIKMILDSWAI